MDLLDFSLHEHGACPHLAAVGFVWWQVGEASSEGEFEAGCWGGFYQHHFRRAWVNKTVYLLCVFPKTYQIPQCSGGPAPVPASPTAMLNNSLTETVTHSPLQEHWPQAPAGWGETRLLQRCGEPGWGISAWTGDSESGVPISMPQFPGVLMGGCVEPRGMSWKSKVLWVLDGSKQSLQRVDRCG